MHGWLAFYIRSIIHYAFVLLVSIEQVEAVVKELCKMSGGKWPLVLWHNKRTRASLDNSSHRKVVEEWIDKGVLYSTPIGSNDDWYALE